MSEETNTPEATDVEQPAAEEVPAAEQAADVAPEAAEAQPEVAPVAPVVGQPKDGKPARVRRQTTKSTMTIEGPLTSTVIVDEDDAQQPESVVLAAPYAYYDDDNQYHSWAQGQCVEDADVIALLIARGVIFETE